MKLIIALDTREPGALPYYLYLGSANFSRSAWGSLEQAAKLYEPTCNTKLWGVNNFECGVFIPGHCLLDLLEEGTESWHEIIPYRHPVPYE